MRKDVRLICKQFIYEIEDFPYHFNFNNCKNHRKKARQWDPNHLDFQMSIFARISKMDSVLPLHA